MKKSRGKKGAGRPQVDAAAFLGAIPHVNEALELDRRRDGSAMASIPMQRPKLLVPPLSWLLPYSSHRRVELDAMGVSVIDLCNGSRTIEAVIELFAKTHKLSFRESQLAIGQYLRQLARRGVVAIVGMEEGAE
jgi:hypothetical protein